MIGNNKQYKITLQQRGLFQAALTKATQEPSDGLFSVLERKSLEGQLQTLQNELEAYDQLTAARATAGRPGSEDLLHTLMALPRDLIQMRHAAGLTQDQLGVLVGLQAQQIQRYEARQYAQGSLRRIILIASALAKQVQLTPDQP